VVLAGHQDIASDSASMSHPRFASHVEVWKDALSTKQKEPYLSHHFAGAMTVSSSISPFWWL
jgi:hypothetical protein